MASLGYGMYGFNTLNVNGETDQLPMCRLMTPFAGSFGNPMNFAEAADDYNMAVPNQGANAGSFSAIRTIVSGLYEIEYAITLTGGAGAGVTELDTQADTGQSFLANGIFNYNGSAGAYQIGFDRQSIAASTSILLSRRIVIFLEKDRYITVAGTTSSGTAATYNGNTYDYFSVRCVAAENSKKGSFQP